MMNRNVTALVNKEYDLVIVGGGIFGICAAWDATLRGLSVALLERGDFAHATSANCFKIVHGGIRYLQHADLYRVRESSHERNVLLRIAPHLVHPLPIAIPTYGHGVQGKAFLRAGLRAYNLITCDRNRGIADPQKRIPRGQVISRQECLRLFPGLERNGLTGAVIFSDAQMHSPARLALSVLKSAVQAGADAVNYVEVTNFLRNGDRMVGVEAEDALTGDRLQIRGKVVLNAAGPWAERLLNLRMGLRLTPELAYSRDAFVIVERSLTERYALAVQGRTADPDAIVSRGRRHLFIVPWRRYSLIGVWHVVHRGKPDEFTVTEEDLQGFIDEMNDAYPPLALTLRDVSIWNAGLVLFGNNQPGAGDLSYGKRSILIDHAKDHGVEGLVTMIGVRYTTARGVAEKAIDLVFRKVKKQPPKAVTAATPIYGGRIEHFDEFLHHATGQTPSAVNLEVMHALLQNHGSEYKEILKYVDQDPKCAETLPGSTVTKAEVVHAVREEMAQKLGDTVFRRTDLGTGGDPGEPALRECAALMASECGWDEGRVRDELAEVRAAFPHACAKEPVRAMTCMS
ncbi:MAG: FAD-dependent oxidoreductase [Gemmatimonadales bacterium]